MRVLLKNDGGYGFFGDVEFPVEVEGVMHPKREDIVRISSEELLRIGAETEILEMGQYYFWNFYLGEEVDII